MKRYQEEMRNIRKYMKADHMKRHREEMRKIREVMETNHEKRLREAVAFSNSAGCQK